jgi:glycosyltransferase involved in cell wall biosynthesis
MKIAIASTYLGQMARGVESWAVDLAAELRRRGLDVTLFRGGGPGEWGYEVYLPCLKHDTAWARGLARLTRHGGWRVGLGSAMAVQQVVFGWRLVWALRGGGYDIVHVQDAWLGRVLEYASRRHLHAAKVIFMHGTEETPEFLSRFRLIQEQAPFYLEEHRRRGVAEGPEWFIASCFVDCDTYSPGDQQAARAKFGLPGDRFIILDVSALRLTHKRLDILIREVAALRESGHDALLVIAGAPTPETPRVECLARAQLGEGCRLLRSVARADMADLYRAADVVAHPSLRELFGLVYVEAMACGTPVVAHCFPVTEWVVGPGGTTVDVEQEGAMTRALLPFMADPQWRRQKSSAAREHVLTMFETHRVVDRYVAMYEKVLRM